MNKREEKLKMHQDQSWNEMYEVAKQYYISHGDLDVPSAFVTPEGKRLGPWLNRQRRVREGKVSGTLDEERIRKLDAISMSWTDLAEERWNRNFRALCDYYDQHGDLDIPQDYVTPDGLNLGQFVKNMRFHKDTKYRKCLTPSRVIMLTEMGMIWDVNEYRWQQSYKAAQAYYQEHGDLKPPKRYITPNGEKLGVWLAYQRRKYTHGALSEQRIEKLNSIGMVWAV